MAHQVSIYLGADSLEICISDGATVRSVRNARLDAAAWDAAWEGRLAPLDELLRSALREGGARRGCPAFVIYSGRDASAEIKPFPLGATEAAEAAELGLSEVNSGGARTGEARVVDSTSTPSPRSQVLIYSDSDDKLSILFDWLRRCGLRPVGAAPETAACLAGAARAFRSCASEEPSAVLYIGPNHSGIAGGAGGELTCIRSIDVGYLRLADQLHRVLAQGKELPAEGAADLLLRIGVPSRDAVVSEAGNIRGDSVLPALFPVLQRFVVETRQTLRFGLGPQVAARARLHVTGPGAAVPGLLDSLSSQLELTAGPPVDQPCGSCASHLAREVGGRGLSPRHERLRRFERATIRSLAAGLALAAGVVAFDALHAVRAHAEVQTDLALIQPELHTLRDDHDRLASGARLAAHIAAVEAAIAEVGARGADYQALLGELSRITSDAVQLREIHGTQSPEGTFATVRGFALTRRTGADSLAEYIERLGTSPLIESVELRSTRAVQHSGLAARDFILNLRLKEIPARFLEGASR